MTSHDWRNWRDGDPIMLDTDCICSRCGIIKGSFVYHSMPAPSWGPVTLDREPDCDLMIVKRIMAS
jgi:hypothetical protein